MVGIGQFVKMFENQVEAWKACHRSREECDQISLSDSRVLRTLLHELLITFVVFKFGAMSLLGKRIVFDVRFIVHLELKGG